MKILKFGAVWCSECLVMKPRFEKIQQELPWLETEYFEFDDVESKDMVAQYNITEPPTFVFIDKNNNEIIRLTGEIDRKELIKLIMEHKDK